MSTEAVQTTALALNCLVWIAVLCALPRLRRRWRAEGWLEHRDQILAKERERRDAAGRFRPRATKIT